jgi:hypothetical protein
VAPLEQRQAEFLLQRAHRMADRRLADLQFLGRTGEAASACRRLERDEAADGRALLEALVMSQDYGNDEPAWGSQAAAFPLA